MFQMSRMLYRIGRACFAHHWLVVMTWLLGSSPPEPA
jgi:hypothetical protein